MHEIKDEFLVDHVDSCDREFKEKISFQIFRRKSSLRLFP